MREHLRQFQPLCAAPGELITYTYSCPTAGPAANLYLYEYAEDLTNGYNSYGGGWYYWGWWQAP